MREDRHSRVGRWFRAAPWRSASLTEREHGVTTGSPGPANGIDRASPTRVRTGGSVGEVSAVGSTASAPSVRPVRRGARVALAVVAAWLVSVGAGLALLGAYESRPGEPAAAPTRWPAT